MPLQARSPSNEERRRQAEVLGGLRNAELMRHQGTPEARQWHLTPVAHRIGVSASQLSRYESGETILPTTCFAAVGAVYGITKTELVRRLGLLDDAADPAWSLEAEFRAAGMDEAAIRLGLDAASEYTDPLFLRAFARAWVAVWQSGLIATHLQHPGDGELPARQAR